MESYFFRVLPSAFLLTWSNPKRARKSAQEQEDQRRRRNKRDRARHAAETAQQRSKRLKKWQERDHARHTAQTVSERQATSQWKNTGERRAGETPEEWKFSDTALWRRRWRCDGITFNFHIVTHILFIHTCPFLARERLDPMILKD